MVSIRHLPRFNRGVFWTTMCLILLAGLPGPGSTADDGFQRVTGPCELAFPRDHGAHEGFRTEWWYYTGNLTAADGHRFGYQFTVFRYRLFAETSAPSAAPAPRSQWRTPQIYLGHIALSDLTGRAHHHQDDVVRAALDLAGVRQTDRQTTVFLKNWHVRIGRPHHRIEAEGREFAYQLRLTPLKPPVLHGDRGYSLKGSEADQASCYYSFTRLGTTGTVRLNRRTYRVEGLSWMDHEFSTAPLAPGIRGWDWFSVQLDDRTELMLFQLRLEQGGVHPASSATLVDEAGAGRHITAGEMTVRVRDHWQSPDSGARYPSRWDIRVPDHALSLSVRSNLADQEMQTGQSTGVTYWEGSVAVSGTHRQRPVEGQGYVELTGYGDKFDAPL